MNNRISIAHFNNRHNDQLRALDFYKAELDMLRNRLTEVAGKNTDKDLRPQIEHYENQFAVQIDNIGRLIHNIRMNIHAVSLEAQLPRAGYVTGALYAAHEQLSADYLEQEQIVNTLRQAFNRFAAQWM